MHYYSAACTRRRSPASFISLWRAIGSQSYPFGHVSAPSSAPSLMDVDAGAAHVPLHHRKQDRGVFRMQPDAAVRRPPAKLADVGRTMDREISAVEDRIRHRCAAKKARAMMERERLRPEIAARRAVNAGRYRPAVAGSAIHDHGHALACLLDIDDDVGKRITAE